MILISTASITIKLPPRQMAVKIQVKQFLLLLSILYTTESVCKTGALTAEEQAVLDAHNTYRAKHEGTDPLCYGVSGSDVTFTAQAWTEQIAGEKAMKHSTGTYGENLATAGTTGTVMAKSPAYEKSTQMWYDEIKDWNFGTSSSTGGVTGHFTQVVWKNSKQLNCGYATYVSGIFNNYMVTCQYYPPGNFNNAYAANVAPLKSTTTPTCSKPTVANAVLSPTTATVNEGEKYTVTCNSGFKLTGGVNTFTCGSDGNLTPTSITCTAETTTITTCNKPTVANAALTPDTATIKEGEKYTVTCTGGTILDGSENTFSCGSDGKLSPTSITCKSDGSEEGKTCSKPTVANAALTPDTATVKEGEKFSVKCNSGYKLKGEVSEFTCGSDGKTSPESITCDKDSGAVNAVISTVLALLVILLH